MRRFTGFVLMTVASLMMVSAARAQTSVGPRRPAAVPADYVVTPFGYFHPSCVNHLAKGDEILQDAKVIQHEDGTSQPIPVCAYPHFRADGEKVIGDERAVKRPDISYAWVEWASVTTTSSYAYLYSFWNVPPAPAFTDGQTVYLFNGLEDIDDVVTIVQPVLGWNADFSNSYGIASWNCCVSGTVVEATPVPVNSGDLIYGYMFATCPAGTLSCSTWDVVTLDLTTQHESELLFTPNFGQTFNWAFGGVMEVYSILQCGDYPSGYSGTAPSIHFYNQGLFNDKFVQIKAPAWQIGVTSGLTPACGYGGSLPKEVILTY